MGQKRMSNNGTDWVNHPPHYTQGGEIECIDYLRDSLGDEGFSHYCEGAVKKYVHRWRYKNGVQDLEKAVWYLEKMIALYTELQYYEEVE